MNYSNKYLIVLWSFLNNEGSWYFLYNTIISPSFVLTFSINRSANSFLHFFINFALVSVNHSSINSFPISAVFLQSHIFIRKSTVWNLTKIDFVNEESAVETHLSSTWARFDDSLYRCDLSSVSDSQYQLVVWIGRESTSELFSQTFPLLVFSHQPPYHWTILASL